MILVRDVFQAKYGKSGELVALFKEAHQKWPDAMQYGRRVLTDASGPFFTVVTATEVEQLDPYVLMAVLGKRVIHPGGWQSTEELLRGRTCNPIRKCSMSAAAWERPRLKSHVAFARMSQSSTSPDRKS